MPGLRLVESFLHLCLILGFHLLLSLPLRVLSIGVLLEILSLQLRLQAQLRALDLPGILRCGLSV